MGKVSALCLFGFLYGLQRFLIRLVVVVVAVRANLGLALVLVLTLKVRLIAVARSVLRS